MEFNCVANDNRQGKSEKTTSSNSDTVDFSIIHDWFGFFMKFALRPEGKDSVLIIPLTYGSKARRECIGVYNKFKEYAFSNASRDVPDQTTLKKLEVVIFRIMLEFGKNRDGNSMTQEDYTLWKCAIRRSLDEFESLKRKPWTPVLKSLDEQHLG